MSKTTAYTREWITRVRGKLDKTSFGKKVIVYRKNGTVCVSVHRNTIGNWESGKTSLPRDVETFLSIALFEYDQEHKDDPVPDRNARLDHARSRLKEMLGLDLYCRNLHDALLISVCRGILSFEEVPSLEKELDEEVMKDAPPNEERDLYAIERNTIPISNDLNKVDSVEELCDCITRCHRNSFASASRIIGARMLQIYRRRNRYPQQVGFYRAVANLAPNYRDSYTRIFTNSFISRNWMIDLSRHLLFSREEIDDVLEAAHMAKLTEDESFADSLFSFNEMDAVAKLETMFLLGLYINDRITWDMTTYPPAIHFLESVSIYEQGRASRQALDRLLDNEDSVNWSYRDVFDRLLLENNGKKNRERSGHFGAWMKYLDMDNLELRREESLQELCRAKTSGYDVMPEIMTDAIRSPDGGTVNKQVRGEVRRLRYLASIYYSVLRGSVFNGTLTEADLNAIQRDFAKEEVDCTYIYRFISKILVVFLGNMPIQQLTDGRFDLADQASGKGKTALDIDMILENLWESILLLKGIL